MILYKIISVTEMLLSSQSHGMWVRIDHPSDRTDRPRVAQWALIEMCKNVDIQNKLRTELVQFGNTDPTWEQLNSSLPYLDAVVHEALRTHPPVSETTRVVRILSSSD